MKQVILFQYLLGIMYVLSSCSVMDVSLPDTNQFLSESSNQIPELQFQSLIFGHMTPTKEEVNLWLAREMDTIYRFSQQSSYMENQEQEQAEILAQERQEVLLSGDIPKLLQYLWAEYPSEEAELLAKETILRYYTLANCELVSIEHEDQSMDYVLTIAVTPLLFPEYFDQSYIQEKFHVLTEGIRLSDLSLEEYSHYDNLTTIALLEEMLQMESIPTGEQVDCQLHLYFSAGGFILPENQWTILHNSLFPA